MDRLRSKYKPEVLQLKAETLLQGVSKEEYAAWKELSCTKALMATIESSIDGIVVTWVKGGFKGTTVDSTAMQQASATGMTEALDGIMTYIDDMLEISQSETEYEEARNQAGWQ